MPRTECGAREEEEEEEEEEVGTGRVGGRGSAWGKSYNLQQTLGKNILGVEGAV